MLISLLLISLIINNGKVVNINCTKHIAAIAEPAPSMITINVNGKHYTCSGNPDGSLLSWLRNENLAQSVHDGCSGEGTCGACTVEINGHPALACRTPVKNLENASVVTTEGLPEDFRQLIGTLFAKHGAVQCGFCSPGFIMRSKKLFERKTLPSRKEIIQTINPNICRCTGYIKIVDAIEAAWKAKNNGSWLRGSRQSGIGKPCPKYQSAETALGDRPFVDDLHVEEMLHGVLLFSKHPRAKIRIIDASAARALDGVVEVFTAGDIPGERFSGLVIRDWPLMIATGEITSTIGDVVAGVVAKTEEIARTAAALVKVGYQELDGVFDMHTATAPDAVRVRPNQSNVLESCTIQHGDVHKAFNSAAYDSHGVYTTRHIEHGFLETECAVAMPDGNGIRLYSQGQGVYVDREQVARILGIDPSLVRVTQVASGGAFGGKEDLSVQGHAALYAWLLKQPVKVRLNRQESIRMHPKRHPVWMDIHLCCDSEGMLTGLKLNALGDTGAYASVGTKVMERVVGHSTGGYAIPNIDVTAKTIYTNNIPSGAMRGFGVPQIVFALESCIDDLCRKGGFYRWQLRYNNALCDGAKTAGGQILQGVGLKKTLAAVKDVFKNARYAGIACAIKNTGVGNGAADESEVTVNIVSDQRVIIHHGWTEMGQGIHTMAIQTLFEETGIDPGIMEVIVDTAHSIPTGMTTSSRGTVLLGNAIRDAAVRIRDDMGGTTVMPKQLNALAGRSYRGKYVCDWTCRPGEKTDNPKIHFAYGYATQVVIIDKNGRIEKVIAAHDAGRIMNPTLFEGQIEGAVHMGIGYALTESLPMKDGVPVSFKYKDLGILRAKQMPAVQVIGIEERDPVGPYGAKGIGEIGMVPTAAAVANAYAAMTGKKITSLPFNMSHNSKQ